METKHDEVSTGLHRVNALLTWWGVPDASWDREGETRIARFRQLTTDLQHACRETCSRQLEVALATSDRLAQSFQALARSRRPQQVVAMESDILATLLESASSHAKAWAELTQRLQDSCAAVAREAADELHRQAGKPSAAAETERRPQKRPVADQAYA